MTHFSPMEDAIRRHKRHFDKYLQGNEVPLDEACYSLIELFAELYWNLDPETYVDIKEILLDLISSEQVSGKLH